MSDASLDRKARAFLPLTEPSFLVLLSLTEPRHGYGIMQHVDALSEGRVKLGPGTLYGALTNLLRQGLIRRTGETGGESERRKVYALTSLGQRVLVHETERFTTLSRLARQRLGGD